MNTVYRPIDDVPTTLEQARGRSAVMARRAGHRIGCWRSAGILWSFHDTQGPEEHAICTVCGASAVAKAGHRPAGSAVTPSCGYTQLMRRLEAGAHACGDVDCR
jgi:hypothetical protein